VSEAQAKGDERLYPIKLTRAQLWLLREQLQAASDPDQRSPNDIDLIELVESALRKADRNSGHRG